MSATKKELKMTRPVRLPSHTHPDRAPKGKTSKDGVQIIASLSIQPPAQRAKRPPPLQAGREQDWYLTVWVPRIWFINPGGICGSFREHKRGRLL